MRKFLLPALAALLACAAHTYPIQLDAGVAYRVLPDNHSLTVFEDALEWSREHRLETGGCFTVYSVSNSNIFVVDAVEVVNWRREDRVQLRCPIARGIWHTHWKPEGPNSVGCNIADGQDIYLIEPARSLGLVICGMTRDSIIPYAYSPEADSSYKSRIAESPTLRANEDSIRKEAVNFTCADEPRESLRRGGVACKR